MRRLAYAPWVALISVAACEPVLGLEKARLESEAVSADAALDAAAIVDAGQMPKVDAAVSECTAVKTDCPCRTACTQERDNCLADSSCRQNVVDYALCLGAECSDPNDARCGEELSFSKNSPTSDLGDCFLERCDYAVCQSAVFTACERYCGCMQDPNLCIDRFNKVWKGDLTACLADCAANMDRVTVDCRADHCEFAVHGASHCTHAYPLREELATQDPCGTTDPRPRVCLDRGSVGYPCNDLKPCCPDLECVQQLCRPR